MRRQAELIIIIFADDTLMFEAMLQALGRKRRLSLGETFFCENGKFIDPPGTFASRAVVEKANEPSKPVKLFQLFQDRIDRRCCAQTN